MESKGEVLYRLYRKDFILLSDSELIEKFAQYSYGVNLHHSFKDEVALEVAGELIIQRKLKTLEELRSIISKDKTEVEEYLDSINKK
jgi:hypothetical protein